MTTNIAFLRTCWPTPTSRPAAWTRRWPSASPTACAARRHPADARRATPPAPAAARRGARHGGAGPDARAGARRAGRPIRGTSPTGGGRAGGPGRSSGFAAGPGGGPEPWPRSGCAGWRRQARRSRSATASRRGPRLSRAGRAAGGSRRQPGDRGPAPTWCSPTAGGVLRFAYATDGRDDLAGAGRARVGAERGRGRARARAGGPGRPTGRSARPCRGRCWPCTLPPATRCARGSRCRGRGDEDGAHGDRAASTAP